jgi:hypothetical protein
MQVQRDWYEYLPPLQRMAPNVMHLTVHVQSRNVYPTIQALSPPSIPWSPWPNLTTCNVWQYSDCLADGIIAILETCPHLRRFDIPSYPFHPISDTETPSRRRIAQSLAKTTMCDFPEVPEPS